VNLEDFAPSWCSTSGRERDGRQSCSTAHCAARRIPGRARGRIVPGFVARMIDHGYTFNGPNWDFPGIARARYYARRLVYDAVHSLADFQPWLDQVIHFPQEVIDQAWKGYSPGLGGSEEDASSNFWSASLSAQTAARPDRPAAKPRPDPFPIGSDLQRA